MDTINVLLAGRLKLDGYGRVQPVDGDGTVRLSLEEGSVVREVVQRLGVPADQVAMIMVNARQCSAATALRAGDRVILIPEDVAALWRFLGLQNLGAESVLDLGTVSTRPKEVQEMSDAGGRPLGRITGGD